MGNGQKLVDQLEKDKIDRIDSPGKRFLIYGQNEKVNSVPVAQYFALKCNISFWLKPICPSF